MKRPSDTDHVTDTIWSAAAPRVLAVHVVPSGEVATAAAPPTPPTIHHRPRLGLNAMPPSWPARVMFDVRRVQALMLVEVITFCPDAPFAITTASVPALFTPTPNASALVP